MSDFALRSRQALLCAEALAGDSAVSVWLGRGLGMPEPGATPEDWAQFLVRWALAVHPVGALAGLLEARSLLAAALVVQDDPDLDLGDVETIAEAIEARVEECVSARELEGRLPRARNLVPATEAEVAALVPLGEAITRAQGGSTLADLEGAAAELEGMTSAERRALEAGLSLLPGGEGL